MVPTPSSGGSSPIPFPHYYNSPNPKFVWLGPHSLIAPAHGLVGGGTTRIQEHWGKRAGWGWGRQGEGKTMPNMSPTTMPLFCCYCALTLVIINLSLLIPSDLPKLDRQLSGWAWEICCSPPCSQFTCPHLPPYLETCAQGQAVTPPHIVIGLGQRTGPSPTPPPSPTCLPGNLPATCRQSPCPRSPCPPGLVAPSLGQTSPHLLCELLAALCYLPGFLGTPLGLIALFPLCLPATLRRAVERQNPLQLIT